MQWLRQRRNFIRARSKVASYSSNANQIVLRPYQESCLVACTDALKAGFTRIGVSLPTGSGKTTVFVSLLSRIAAHSSAKRSLVIVNSVELARQAASQVETLFPSWSVEIEQGLKHKASGLADVTVATYQTLLREHRIAKFDPAGLKAIVIDEAHHAAAPSYRRLLSHFHSSVKHPDEDFAPCKLSHDVPIIGFSATFSRHDGLALGSVFEQIVYHQDFLEMIKAQWLCNVRFTSVRAQVDLSSVTINTRTGDFNPTSLAQVINTVTMNYLVVQTWLDCAAERKSTLVFCVNLAHVRDLTQTFRKFGIDARYIHSKTPTAERKALVSNFRNGQFPVLVNCAILTEGADIPNIDCVFVARPTRSRNVFAQMIGRGMRLSPETNKLDCRIIDFVDSTHRVAGVISTPTLFGLDPAEVIIADETAETLEKRSANTITREIGVTVPEPKSVTYTDYENPFSLDEGAPHIARLSSNAWIDCGADVYILELLGKGYIRIEPIEPNTGSPEEKFQAYYTPTMDKVTALALKISPFMHSRKVLSAKSLDAAVRGCDTYAQSKVLFGPRASGLLRSAKWRRYPASDQQKNFISKRFGKHRSTLPPDVLETEVGQMGNGLDNLTKGQAATIITRLRHGALGRFKKRVKAASKVAGQLSKERDRQARESVSVGPLHDEAT